jgi:hypothetical protein
VSSPSDPEFENPYASPMADSSSVSSFSDSVDFRLSREVQEFRTQIHALGALWMIIGVIALGAGVALALNNQPNVNRGIIGLTILCVVGAIWLAFGLLTCLKQIWAVYIGLALTYVSLLGNLVSFNPCGLVIPLIVIVQAHRVIGWAKKMTAAGIPLTAKRTDFL